MLNEIKRKAFTGRNKKTWLLLVVIFIFSTADFSQDLVTDRPDFTESATAVSKGSWQLEFGYTFEKDILHLTGPYFVDRIFSFSDRPSSSTSRNLQTVFNHGRLARTGYLSILPVDQGIELSAGAFLTPNPFYFDPENIVNLAIEDGCNANASTLGVLGAVSRKYAHKIPFIAKINHNELLTYQNSYDQRLFASVQQAFDMCAIGVGAAVYFGSQESRRQIEELSRAFEQVYKLGIFTVLWFYLRNEAFKQGDMDYHTSADLTWQANHLGVTIEADLIKQKQPKNNGGMKLLIKVVRK